MLPRLALVVILGAAGCFAHAEDTCRGCALVHWNAPVPPVVPEGKIALVVLVHGAFGFGGEWVPIRAALDRRPELSYFAFVWGLFGGAPPRRAEAFRRTLQAAVNALPSTASEVLVLAHSAGGPIAEFAAHRLIVPPGVHVRIALLDAARISMAPYRRSDSIDTPLGISLGEIQQAEPPLPPGVEIDDFPASDPPKRGAIDVDRARPREIGTVSRTGEHVHYLGRKVTHGGSVALAGLPLIEQLGR